MIQNISVGTTTLLIVKRVTGKLCDFFLQNLSGNNVYLVNSSHAIVGNGIKIVPNDTYGDDQSDEELYLIADGAASDVRLRRNYYDPKTR